MEKAKQTWYFLGANSPTGFTSLYDGFVDQESDQLYILKGGPGCGKSSFMKVVASDMESAGFAAEYIQCSGDPDSLDGVYFPELNVAFADGTAPHVMEPKYPGITASYINLGRFYDTAALSAYREMIVLLHAEYKHLYDAAYKYIQASQLVCQELRDSLASRKLYGKMEKKAQSLCRREFGTPAAGSGKIKMRFLDAFTCQGAICRWDTVQVQAEKVYVIDNELGFSSQLITEIAAEAVAAGYGAILCPSPMEPDTLRHLLIPELSLAFVSTGLFGKYPAEPYRHIMLDSAVLKDCSKDVRAAVRRKQRHAAALLTEAQEQLAAAKALHDELESYYNPHVDFDGVYKLASGYSRALLART